MRKLLTIFLTLSALLALSACNGNDTADDTGDRNGEEEVSDDELEEFTLEELSQYDGQEGRDAYVAVDGYVYDMTDSSYWIEGSHQNQVQAGQDLTDEIDSDSPHGRSALFEVPRIGILVDSEGATD